MAESGHLQCRGTDQPQSTRGKDVRVGNEEMFGKDLAAPRDADALVQCRPGASMSHPLMMERTRRNHPLASATPSVGPHGPRRGSPSTLRPGSCMLFSPAWPLHQQHVPGLHQAPRPPALQLLKTIWGTQKCQPEGRGQHYTQLLHRLLQCSQDVPAAGRPVRVPAEDSGKDMSLFLERDPAPPSLLSAIIISSAKRDLKSICLKIEREMHLAS